MNRGDHRRSGGHEHRYHGGSNHRHTGGDSHTGRGTGEDSVAGGAGVHDHSFGGGGGGGGHSTAMDATFVWKLSKLGRIGSSRLRFDDDFIDRLNYQYTGVLMFLFIGLIGIRQYVGKPIQCWIPQEFTRGWEEYAENYCWVSNTYFAPVENRLPPVPDRELLLIGYYQWAPIVMAIQAMAFYLPCLIWRLFMSQSGFNVRRILQMACDSNVLLPEHTMKNVRFIARYMEGCIYRQRDYRRRKPTGFVPVNYSGLASGGGVPSAATIIHPTYQTLHYHHHHHRYPYSPHGQSPPYISTVNAPPVYPTAGSLRHTGGARKASAQSQSENGGRGNGGTPSLGFHSSRSNKAPHRSRSIFARLRHRLSLSATESLRDDQERKKLKVSKSSKLDPIGSEGEELCGTGGSLQGSDMHPMLERQKSATEDSRQMPIGRTLSPSGLGRSGRFCCPTDSKSVGTTAASPWGCCGKQHGNFLVVLYFFIKVLYLTNIIAQLYMMEKFVGHSYTFYGLRVLIDLVQGREWFHSGNFPRVTFCDFEAKKLGKNHKYTLQCVLPLNMFLEKIYIFLWFWHCVLGLLTLCSFIVWFYRMGFAHRRVKFVRKYLKIMSVLRDTDKAASRRFVENYLRPDGVFLIRLISINVGDLMAGDLTCELWHIYRHRRQQETEYEQKHLDASAGGGDFLVNSPIPTVGFDTGLIDMAVRSGTVGGTDRGRQSGAQLTGILATAPLHTAVAASNNNLSTNNDDSIV